MFPSFSLVLKDREKKREALLMVVVLQVPTLMATATPSQDEKMALWPDYFSEPKQTLTEPTIQE